MSSPAFLKLRTSAGAYKTAECRNTLLVACAEASPWCPPHPQLRLQLHRCTFCCRLPSFSAAGNTTSHKKSFRLAISTHISCFHANCGFPWMCKGKQSLLIVTSLCLQKCSILDAELDTVCSCQSLPWCHLSSAPRKVHTTNFVTEMQLANTCPAN